MTKAARWTDASALEAATRTYSTVINGCWSMDVPHRRVATNIGVVSEMRAGLRRSKRSARCPP